MDIASCFLAAGDIELATARRAGADEDRVVIFAEQLLQASMTVSGRRNFGIWLRIMPPALGSASNTVQ